MNLPIDRAALKARREDFAHGPHSRRGKRSGSHVPGVGIPGMPERPQSFGCELEIHSSPRGTLRRGTIPRMGIKT